MNDSRLVSWPEMPVTVIVGAGGMGMAIAKRLGQNSRLIIADLNQKKLNAVGTELTESGYTVNTYQCDVTKENSVKEFASLVDTEGGYRTLVHVAGLSPSMADWKTIMAVNLLGPVYMARYLLPLAKPNTAAVFIASLAAHMASPNEAVSEVLSNPSDPKFLDKLIDVLGEEPNSSQSYMLSKKGLIEMCQRLSPAWGEKKARILTVSPGLIATPMGMLEFKNQPMKYTLLEKTPLKRQGNMHEIADAVEFVSSDKASFITGTDILVDGGIHAVLKFGKEQ